MKTFYKIIGLTIIDFVLIWLWDSIRLHDESTTIAIIFLIPFVFLSNIIISGILLVAKKREYSFIFFMNSFIATIIAFYIFFPGIDSHKYNPRESWEFQKADSTFTLTIRTNLNNFLLSNLLNSGLYCGIWEGQCQKENDEWILIGDSLKMKIINDNTLIGFRKKTDTIRMKRIKS